MTTLRGARVLLTGASRGLGRALALRLADEGAHLALAARDEAALRAVADEVEARGGRAAVLPVDLADPATARALASRAEGALGCVDVVVHNAGIEPFTPFETADPAAVERAVAVNLTAALLLTREVAPGMLARGRGHLVFMGSVSGLFAAPHAAPHAATYAATKAALAALSRSLSVEYADRGIRCTVVQPGFVVGAGMFEDARAGRDLQPPRLLGATTPEAVVEAVIDGLRRERPEVIVNSVPLAPLLAVGRLAPGFGLRVVERLAGAFLRRLARG